MNQDKDDWIMDKCEYLSQERYNMEFDALPNNIQYEVFTRAEADWIAKEVNKADTAIDNSPTFMV